MPQPLSFTSIPTDLTSEGLLTGNNRSISIAFKLTSLLTWNTAKIAEGENEMDEEDKRELTPIMISYTRGKWRLESDRCNIERIVSDTPDGCTVAVAGIHHQTLQPGLKPLGYGSGLLAERTANAQLLLNAPDLFKYALLLRELLNDICTDLFNAIERGNMEQIKALADFLQLTHDEFLLFDIVEQLANLDNLKEVPNVPVSKHRNFPPLYDKRWEDEEQEEEQEYPTDEQPTQTN